MSEGLFKLPCRYGFLLCSVFGSDMLAGEGFVVRFTHEATEGERATSSAHAKTLFSSEMSG